MIKESIFLINDIDDVFVKLLELDDALHLAQVNKYYNNVINKNILIQEYRVFQSKKYKYGHKFFHICEMNLINLAKWWFYKFHTLTQIKTIFSRSCIFGHLNMAKWLYSLGYVKICYDKDYEEALSFSCMNNYLETAKFVYSIGKDCVSYNDMREILNQVFTWSCTNNQLYIAKWVYSLGGINIHAGNNCAFRCSYGETREWLQSL